MTLRMTCALCGGAIECGELYQQVRRRSGSEDRLAGVLDPFVFTHVEQCPPRIEKVNGRWLVDGSDVGSVEEHQQMADSLGRSVAAAAGVPWPPRVVTELLEEHRGAEWIWQGAGAGPIRWRSQGGQWMFQPSGYDTWTVDPEPVADHGQFTEVL